MSAMPTSIVPSHCFTSPNQQYHIPLGDALYTHCVRHLVIIVSAFALIAWDASRNHGRLMRSVTMVVAEAGRQTGLF